MLFLPYCASDHCNSRIPARARRPVGEVIVLSAKKLYQSRHFGPHAETSGLFRGGSDNAPDGSFYQSSISLNSRFWSGNLNAVPSPEYAGVKRRQKRQQNAICVDRYARRCYDSIYKKDAYMLIHKTRFCWVRSDVE